jgi:hypothetical protein
VVSKPSIGFKVKAERGVQPQTDIAYFKDLNVAADKDIGTKGFFEIACNSRGRGRHGKSGSICIAIGRVIR